MSCKHTPLEIILADRVLAFESLFPNFPRMLAALSLTGRNPYLRGPHPAIASADDPGTANAPTTDLGYLPPQPDDEETLSLKQAAHDLGKKPYKLYYWGKKRRAGFAVGPEFFVEDGQYRYTKRALREFKAKMCKRLQ